MLKIYIEYKTLILKQINNLNPTQQNMNCDYNFIQALQQHSQCKMLQQKLTMLKKSLRQQRQKCEHTKQEIERKRNIIAKQQEQIIRKNQLNQNLNQEINEIMRQIIQVRAKKKKLINYYMSLQSDNDSGVEGIKSIQTSQN